MDETNELKEQPDTPLIISTLDKIELSHQAGTRKHNVARILKAIYESPGITRKSLVSRFTIRPGTITEIVQQLITDGMVYEVHQENVLERGRPEIALFINKTRWLAIVISCASREMQAILINSVDEIVCRTCIHIPVTSDNAEFEGHIRTLVGDLQSANPCPAGAKLLGIYFSVPGIVDSINNLWVFSSRWPKMRNLNLDFLHRDTGLDISIRRQLDVQLNYQLIRRPTLNQGNTLLFHWGYGIGGAFASKGEIIGSQAGVFCQIGHISLNPDSTRQCICGRMGCLESEAAFWALQPEIEKVYPGITGINENQASDFLKEHPISDQDFFRKAQKNLASALSYLQAILVPDHVLLYGLFLEDRHIQELLVERIKTLSPPFVAEFMNVEFIKVSSSSNARAIAFFAFRSLFEDYIAASKAEFPSRIDEPVQAST